VIDDVVIGSLTIGLTIDRLTIDGWKGRLSSTSRTPAAMDQSQIGQFNRQ
jgi:hypothetical protein